MKLPRSLTYYFLLFFLLGLSSGFAQIQKQAELEKRRQEILKEIDKINSLWAEGKKEQRSVLSVVEDLSYKVSVRQNLINVTNQQANLLTKQINDNQNRITRLRAKLELLKEEYAAMIVKSYKSKSEQSKVMFLLSSSNFQQAYKRLQYIKQYADYQKKQADLIKEQTLKIQELNIALSKQKEEKQKLIEENRKAKAQLTKERKEQEALVASIKRNLSTYTAQIRKKQQEVDRIDREIEKIIREAMATSNAKAGKSTTAKTFAMTPEEKNLAANFTANKGKLPWPVEEGVIKVRYGNQSSLIDKNVKINSKGVRIATNKDQPVRAVFNGIVHTIMSSKNGELAVLIQHGNYFTVYKKLTKLKVKKGDRVTTKQVIGEVITNRSSGESQLHFQVWKNGKPENPANWVYKM